MYDVVYFSNVSENTKRFVDKLNVPSQRIPIYWNEKEPLRVRREYVLVLPTYGGGNDNNTVPKQVVRFLNIEENRRLMRGVIGTGNTNFGDHYCMAAEIVAAKVGVPLLYRVEVFGTPNDVQQVLERLEHLWKTTAITN